MNVDLVLKDNSITTCGKNLIRNDIEYTYSKREIVKIRRAHWSNYCVKFYFFEISEETEKKLCCRVRHYKTKIWK